MVSALPEQGLRQKFMRLVSHARRSAVAIRVRVKRGVIRVVPSVGATLARRRRDVIPVRLRKAAIPVLPRRAVERATPVRRRGAVIRAVPVTPAIHVAELQLSN